MSEYIARTDRMRRAHQGITDANGLDKAAESEANKIAEELAIELQRLGLSGNIFQRVAQRMGGTKPLDAGSYSTEKERVPTGSMSGARAREQLQRMRFAPGEPAPVSGRQARLDLARRRRIWREQEALQRPGVGSYRQPGRPL
jgi:hypothetical protein